MWLYLVCKLRYGAGNIFGDLLETYLEVRSTCDEFVYLSTQWLHC